MLEYVHRHRVRYRECDPMSVVYHAHYVDYFEAARTEALRAHGFPYKDLEDAGIIMPVVALNAHYHKPARYDDLLDVRVWFPEPPKIRVRTEYEVRRADEPTLLVSGSVVLCFFDTTRDRIIRIPPSLLDVFDRAAAES